MEKASGIAGMEMDSDEDFEYNPSTPRLPVLSTPLWGFHSEPPGMTTPPLNNFASCVPFQWEEIPGKPKQQQDEYYSTSPAFTWNDYQDNDGIEPLTEPKAKRAQRGFLVSLNLPDCMTCNTQQLEIYDVDETEYRMNFGSLRVIEDAYTARPYPPFPTSTFFVTRRRNRPGWVVRKMCRCSSFFVSMWRRTKRVVSVSRKKRTSSDDTPR